LSNGGDVACYEQIKRPASYEAAFYASSGGDGGI